MRNIFCGIILIGLLSPSLGAAKEPPSVFVKKCKTCHGTNGVATKVGFKRGAPADLFKAVHSQGIEEIKDTILNGAFTPEGKKKMPAYKNKLTVQEIDEIIKYIKEG